MIKIIKNIKNYFSEKENGENTGLAAPKGMCPICWGIDEWDGHYYEVIKDKHKKNGNEIYESFISKIVDKHVISTHKHNNKYICTTCKKEI